MISKIFTALPPLLLSAAGMFGDMGEGFSYIQGSFPERALDSDHPQVKIGCWNICGTDQSQIYGGVVHWQYRLPGIIEKVRDVDPDVMVFQEVYDPEVTEILVEGLKDRYAHLFVHLGPNPEGYEGGCMVLSKCPIHHFSNTSFINNTLKLNRGFATLELKATEQDTAPCLRVIGTHILYGYNDEEKEKREAQIDQIKEHVHSLPPCPTLIAADFNIERDDPLLSFLEPGYKEKAATCMTTSLLKQWDKAAVGPDEEWIDNISLFKGDKGTIQAHLVDAFDPSSCDAKTALSDHHLLVGTYTQNGQLPFVPANSL